MLKYPERVRAFAPPHCRECVSTSAVGIPFRVGYFNAAAVCLKAFEMRSAVTSNGDPYL